MSQSIFRPASAIESQQDNWWTPRTSPTKESRGTHPGIYQSGRGAARKMKSAPGSARPQIGGPFRAAPAAVQQGPAFPVDLQPMQQPYTAPAPDPMMWQRLACGPCEPKISPQEQALIDVYRGKNEKLTQAPPSPPTTETGSTMSPSTTDHSDIDELAPQSPQSTSPSLSDAPPLSPEAAHLKPPAQVPDANGNNVWSWRDQNWPPPFADEVPRQSDKPSTAFASLVGHDREERARAFTRSSRVLNAQLGGELRSLEDEMAELTSDLLSLRDQMKR